VPRQDQAIKLPRDRGAQPVNPNVTGVVEVHRILGAQHRAGQRQRQSFIDSIDELQFVNEFAPR
jgi:hypothetical protein